MSDAIRVSIATGNRLITHLLQSVIHWLIDTIYTSRSQDLKPRPQAPPSAREGPGDEAIDLADLRLPPWQTPAKISQGLCPIPKLNSKTPMSMRMRFSQHTGKWIYHSTLKIFYQRVHDLVQVLTLRSIIQKKRNGYVHLMIRFTILILGHFISLDL